MNNNPLQPKPWWKQALPYVAAIAIFIVFALIYCSPILDGKIVQAGDTKSWEGMYQENKAFHETTGEYSWWTGSMFCGMPSYQIGGGQTTRINWGKPISLISRLGFAGTLSILIGYFLGFFILLKAFKADTKLAIIGSLAISMSSYFFLIIPAGHVTKAVTIGLMAPVIAGFYLIFQKKYGWGIILTMIYTCIGFMQHPQMSYYICMLIGILFCAELYTHIKEKRFKDLGLGILLFAVAMGVGLGTGYAKYKSNSEYVKETMRGGHSELVKDNDATNKTSGLDLDYATAWSYGIKESLTFMVPGFMGNSSNYNAGTNSETYKTLVSNGVPRRNAEDFCKNVPTYWGDQPFTAGPVYMGAIVCFLFVLGLCIVKGPYKWALLVATLFSVLLSWGHNFMPLTNFFFDYFPMYNKFRAVSSILIVAEITMPLLGFLAVKAIMDKEVDKKKVTTSIYISAGITAGICLILALFGKAMFNFSSPNDEQVFSQLPEWLSAGILADRAAMLQGDAFRSFIFIVLGAGLLWLFANEKLKSGWFISIFALLILCDMWPIDRRFFNDDNFVSKKQDESYFQKMPYEEELLAKEKDPNYRVWNLASNTFNESRTSYYFKSIGGYHAAKLRRYQDLIDQHIAKTQPQFLQRIDTTGGTAQMTYFAVTDSTRHTVVDMLNTKYLFVPLKDGGVQVLQNANAMGNAWFVDSLLVVNTPNEECGALATINLENTAVTDAKFADFTKNFVSHHDSTATVKLTDYAPNRVEYDCSAADAGTIVFSEIYYPYGWKAFIDDKPVEHFRANYALRALNVPAGKHHIRFIFDPDSVRNGAKVNIACYIIMYLTIFGFAGWGIYRSVKRRKETVK